MLEKPDIPDGKIVFALNENYAIPVAGIKFLPIGMDSSAWAYRVKAENDTYFLKLRKDTPNPAGILIPRFLKDQGIEQVMAPLSTKDGAAWARADDFYFMLYPFITGKRVIDVGMPDARWVELGSVLKRLHTTKPTPEILSQLRYETFIPKQLPFAKELHAQVKACNYHDPFQKELAAFWMENFGTISTIIERSEFLAKKMRETDLEFVLCHADIHTANLLLTEDDHFFIVDWDETILAPKERDLLFIIGSIFNDTSDGRWEQLFFEGYGETKIDQLALAYYRYDWCVEDIGSFAERVFTEENVGEETKTNSLWWFKNLFAQGNSVDTALKTDIEI